MTEYNTALYLVATSERANDKVGQHGEVLVEHLVQKVLDRRDVVGLVRRHRRSQVGKSDAHVPVKIDPAVTALE